MPPQRQARPRLYLLLVSFCVLPAILVLGNLSWLKQQSNDLVFLITGIAGTVAILSGLVLSIVHDRGMGEWERSNQRFATFWGDAVGTSLVAFALCLPAGRDWIVSTVTHWVSASRTEELVILSFVLGFMVVVLTRGVCMAALSVGWTLWKSRAPREAA